MNSGMIPGLRMWFSGAQISLKDIGTKMSLLKAFSHF